MVGVRQCNSARESSVYADCNVDTNSSPAGYGYEHSYGSCRGVNRGADAHCNAYVDFDAKFGGNGHAYSDGLGSGYACPVS